MNVPDLLEWTYRARPLRVIDGDTVELRIDMGFHASTVERIRLRRVDAEERNSTDELARLRAKAATDFVQDWLLEAGMAYSLDDWPLIVTTDKDRQSWGRFIGSIWRTADGASLEDDLAALGLVDWR